MVQAAVYFQIAACIRHQKRIIVVVVRCIVHMAVKSMARRLCRIVMRMTMLSCLFKMLGREFCHREQVVGFLI